MLTITELSTEKIEKKILEEAAEFANGKQS